MLHAVIMAGGSGTRFWPASRRSRPKQLLSLASDVTLLGATVERILPLVPTERVWVVTTEATVSMTSELLPMLAPDHVLGEPEGRDTAACVGWAADTLLAIDPAAVCLVLPADHVIGHATPFRDALAAGAKWVEAEGGLLTFGIRPSRPDTGFGYLRVGNHVGRADSHDIHVLDRFVEKPDSETARGYVADGRFLWNSGMFAWRAADLRAEIERQLPLLAAGLDRIIAGRAAADPAQALAEIYPTLPRISVDFGIMEGARRCWTMPVNFGWSDVGSWPALADVLPADDHGTVSRGRVVTVDAPGCILIGDGPAVAAVGVHDLVVVATEDAVLVVPIEHAQRVKEVVSVLRERGWEDLL